MTTSGPPPPPPKTCSPAPLHTYPILPPWCQGIIMPGVLELIHEEVFVLLLDILEVS